MVDTITLSLNPHNPSKPVRFDLDRVYEWIPNIKLVAEGKRSPLYGKGCLSHYRPPLESEKHSGLYFPEVKLLEHVKRGSGVQQCLRITLDRKSVV